MDWLAVSGGLLAALNWSPPASCSAARRRAHYEPARLENGVVEPGRLGN
ncbi:MAG: hypothetical protein U1E53_02125 [Dongiaceae bacterium]